MLVGKALPCLSLVTIPNFLRPFSGNTDIMSWERSQSQFLLTWRDMEIPSSVKDD